MAHQFYAGVRNINRGATWHTLETAIAMQTAADLLTAARNKNAWPVSIKKAPLISVDGLTVDGTFGIRASYASGPDRILAVAGSVWTDLLEQWEQTIQAACGMGARPLMGYALTDTYGRPSRLLATFDLPDATGVEGSTIKPYLLGICGLDGKTVDRWVDTSVDTVCANTLAMAMTEDRAARKASGKSATTVRHTGKGAAQYAVLRDGITRALQTGRDVASAHAEARETILTGERAREAFDALFQRADEDASDNAKTRAENKRAEARRACALPINRRDNAPGSLQTLWNASTYLIDRDLDGDARSVRGGGDAIASMVTGTRGQRVQEIQEVIYRVLGRDGSEIEMTASEAVDAGAVSGSDLLASMLD
jgi:hypothetical protein